MTELSPVATGQQNFESIPHWQDNLPTHVFDHIASESPDRIYGLWPNHPFSYDLGFRTVTFRDLADAINALAWWIEEQLGRPSRKEEVLTYVGPNDLRYVALGLAAVKSGYLLFLTSPRNSSAAHRALFERLQCNTLLTTKPTPPQATPIIQAIKPRVLAIPDIAQLLGEKRPPYPYHKSWKDDKSDGGLILHTSGSTGIPKPLVWVHETSSRSQNLSALSAPCGFETIEGLFRRKRIMVTLPPFHGAGVGHYLFNPVCLETIPIAPAAKGIVTAQGLLEALKQTPAEVAFLVPSVVAELALDPSLLDECARYLELIVYIGGDLPQALGDAVAAKIRLRCQWGASEVGTPQQLISSELAPTDWRYIQFHPSAGAEFEEATNGLYELAFKRRTELSQYQALFTVRGQEQLDVYHTRDYFSRHPTVPNAWCWQARVDDIIVFLNGEKTNPLPMEQQVVAQNPELAGALVFGSQRFQAGLLIEPGDVDSVQTAVDQAALIERVWPSVERANRDSPAHARVERSFILITKADKPMIRSGKGTVQRAGTLKQYAEEIEKAYADADTVIPEDSCAAQGYEDYNRLSIATPIRIIVQSVTGWESLHDGDVFFDKGMDSLQALQITRALRRRLGRPELSLSIVYTNPTVKELAESLSTTNSTGIPDNDILDSLQSTYTSLVKSVLPATITRPPNVILTGSTGHLGAHILHSILGRSGIGRVFCLNRGADGGRAVTIERLTTADLLASAEIEKRVTFLQADLAHPRLGLNGEIYETLISRTGLIIHNAWPVNFALQLQSFRPQLAGIVNLSTLAASVVPQPAKIVFISSVSAVLPSSSKKAPEGILDTPPLSLQGYGRSKFISEKLLDTAARDLGIPVIVARVGQAAGAVRQKGLWNPSEWLPSMISSSLHLGCLPNNLGIMQEVDWIPFDFLGDIIVDISTAVETARARNHSGALVFNLRNPNVTSWTELVPAVQAAAKELQGIELEIVCPTVWIERLRQSSTELVKDGDRKELTAAITRNPAIKLLEFYSNSLWAKGVQGALMEVGLANALSPTLQSLPAVNAAWIAKWMEEWIEQVHVE